MLDSIKQQLTQSASDFQSKVWPAIKECELVGGGDLIPVEAVSTTNFKDELDLLAGVDAWHVLKGRHGMRGIASRIQWKDAYDSFSIRYINASSQESEYTKRLRAIDSEEGLLYPYLTVQAYLDEPGGNLISAAIIPTKILIKKVEFLLSKNCIKEENYDARWGIKTNPDDGNKFVYLKWNYLDKAGLSKSMFVHRA